MEEPTPNVGLQTPAAPTDVPLHSDTVAPARPPAEDILKKFLVDNNLEIKVSPIIVKKIDGGGVIVEPPAEITVSYK